MAERPKALWLMLVYLLSESLFSSTGLPFEMQRDNTSFDCKLDINQAHWAIECESDDPVVISDASTKFFVVRLYGILPDLVSPLTFEELLNSTSSEASGLYTCDLWLKYILNTIPSTLSKCEKSKYSEFKKLQILKGSVKNLKMTRVSKPDFALDLLSEFPFLEDIIITNNSMQELLSIPIQAINSVISLSLKQDEIANITGGTFQVFPNLSSLDLSYNLLRDVRKELFEGISALSYLDMSHNLIDSISSSAFSNLPSLTDLFLVSNKLTVISADMFRFNSVLSVVDLSHNDLKHLPAKLFNNMTNLKNVSCSNCSLDDWDKDIFLNTNNLQWLNFSHNNLRILHLGIFRILETLQVVDMGSNNISYLDENLFPKHPFLMLLILDNNQISFLKNGIFTGAHNIKILDLNRNKIKMLTDDHVKKFGDLEFLGLRQNRLVKVELGTKDDKIKIRVLDISNNYIKKLNIGWKKLIYMEDFRADNNQLTSIDLPPCIQSVKQTLTFSFRNNKISRINIDALIGDEQRAKFDRSVAGCFFNGLAKNFVDLTHNPLLCDCKLYPFYDYVRKKSPRKYQMEMFIDKGNLTCANPLFLKNQSLISLSDDVISCPISEKCPLTCHCGIRGKDDLIFVNCSSRNLDEIPQITPNRTTVLYANGNNLISLTSLNTDVWRNLRELHLDDNLLTELDVWKFPTSLRYLSVRGNRLKILPRPLMEFISNLTDFQLFFGNNDRNCDCDRKKLKAFLLQNIGFVGDNEDILCVVTSNDTSELLPLTSVPNNSICPPASNGFDTYQKNLTISLSVFFTFLIVLVLAYYKQRELILSFLYIHCDDLFRLFCLEENDEKLFDAFVAYSSSDREIVLKLLQELEDNPPFFQLCIHERNWLPGRFITDNIVNSVESSRRTIVVVSSTFISSPWFNLELRAAIFKMSKDKISRIIIILTDKSVSLDSIDPEIRHVISIRTYLVWGERWFWEKLRYAMPKRKAARHSVTRSQSNGSVSEMALVPSIV